MRNTSERVPPDSAPSLVARLLAFTSIIVAGACGGLIGFAVTDIGCSNGCQVEAGLVGLLAAIVTAAATAVVAVLVLRSSAEWRAYSRSAPASDQPDDADNSTSSELKPVNQTVVNSDRNELKPVHSDRDELK